MIYGTYIYFIPGIRYRLSAETEEAFLKSEYHYEFELYMQSPTASWWKRLLGIREWIVVVKNSNWGKGFREAYKLLLEQNSESRFITTFENTSAGNWDDTFILPTKSLIEISKVWSVRPEGQAATINHTKIGIYANKSFKILYNVSDDDLIPEIMYDLRYRPGRALIVDNVLLYSGYLPWGMKLALEYELVAATGNNPESIDEQKLTNVISRLKEAGKL